MTRGAEYTARSNFMSYARGAARAEQKADWAKAIRLWRAAILCPVGYRNREHAEIRLEHCRRALEIKLVLPESRPIYWFTHNRNYLWFDKRPKDAIVVRTIGEPRRVDGKIIVEINKEPYFVNVCRLIPAR